MSDNKTTGEPRWIGTESVVAYNEEVDKSGERYELRDRFALERALAHPWNVYVCFMVENATPNVSSPERTS